MYRTDMRPAKTTTAAAVIAAATITALALGNPKWDLTTTSDATTACQKAVATKLHATNATINTAAETGHNEWSIQGTTGTQNFTCWTWATENDTYQTEVFLDK